MFKSSMKIIFFYNEPISFGIEKIKKKSLLNFEIKIKTNNKCIKT